MNIERAHAIALAIKQELLSLNLVDTFQQLTDALATLVSQPTGPYQEMVATQRTAILEILKNAPSNNYSPAWRDILDNEFKISHLLGNGLALRIEDAFIGNDLTPATARDILSDSALQLKALQTQINAFCASLDWLEIGSEKLDPGQCEVGFMIPRKAIENKFCSLAEEFEEFDFVIRSFSELVEGEVESPKVRSISSTDFMVFLETHHTTAAAIAFALERTINLYHTLLKIKKLRNELNLSGVSEVDLKGIETHANNVMKDGIEALVKELLKKHNAITDKGRKNEVANRLRISMNRLANRIDRGFNVEIRIEPLGEEGAPKSENKEVAEAQQIIQNATSTLQFIKTEGQPILNLPETEPSKPNLTNK